jgi:Putative DNA-binding domain
MLFRPLTAKNRMQPLWVDGSKMTDVVGEFVKPNDRLTSFERLEIYNRQYWFRVLDSFYEDYPGLRAVLGERTFIKMAEAYLVKYCINSAALRFIPKEKLKEEGYSKYAPLFEQTSAK